MQYRVQGIPAVKAFRDGEVVDEFVGAQPESEVRAFLKRVAPGEEDQLMDQVRALLHDLDWSEAEERLRDAPSTPAVALSRAKALLGKGEGCEANRLLQDIEEPALYAESQRLLPLAEYLCQFHEDAVDGDVGPMEAQYRHAAMLIRRHNIEAALDGLLELLRQDKHYADGEARAVVLGLFALLGDDNPLTRRYRSELAMILF
jgi:putative thioredoxin